MKRALLTIVPAIALIGGVQAWAATAPADPAVEPTQTTLYPGEPPYVPVEPVPADWEPMYPDQALNDWRTDGYAVYGLETFPTTPQHDQCWRNDGGEILESGTFVIYGNDDPRDWGSHSIGAMNCGPADLPTPAATAPLAATQGVVPQYDASGESCD